MEMKLKRTHKFITDQYFFNPYYIFILYKYGKTQRHAPLGLKLWTIKIILLINLLFH